MVCFTSPTGREPLFTSWKRSAAFKVGGRLDEPSIHQGATRADQLLLQQHPHQLVGSCTQVDNCQKYIIIFVFYYTFLLFLILAFIQLIIFSMLLKIKSVFFECKVTISREISKYRDILQVYCDVS